MYITVFSIIIPIGVGLWRHSYLETEVKWLLYLLIPVSLNQFISVAWLHFVGSNNIPFYHFFIFIELLFLSRIYFLYLRTSTMSRIIAPITIAFSLFYIVLLCAKPNVLFNYTVSTQMRALEGVVVLFFVGSYFVDVYRKERILYLHKTAGFWIGGGLLLYFLSNLVLFAFSELIFAQESEVFQSLWAVHGVLVIMLYLNFTIAFLCKKTVTTS